MGEGLGEGAVANECLGKHRRAPGYAPVGALNIDTGVPLSLPSHRTAIVLKLLAAADQEAAQLVGCVNRYGQSAVHIGADNGQVVPSRFLCDPSNC